MPAQLAEDFGPVAVGESETNQDKRIDRSLDFIPVVASLCSPYNDLNYVDFEN
jgi:hypothetical protein